MSRFVIVRSDYRDDIVIAKKHVESIVINDSEIRGVITYFIEVRLISGFGTTIEKHHTKAEANKALEAWAKEFE